MGVTEINKILLSGDKTVAKDFMGQAQSQMEILKQEMSFQKLKQGIRKVWLYKNVSIECKKIFDYQECRIWVEPTPDNAELRFETKWAVLVAFYNGSTEETFNCIIDISDEEDGIKLYVLTDPEDTAEEIAQPFNTADYNLEDILRANGLKLVLQEDTFTVDSPTGGNYSYSEEDDTGVGRWEYVDAFYCYCDDENIGCTVVGEWHMTYPLTENWSEWEYSSAFSDPYITERRHTLRPATAEFHQNNGSWGGGCGIGTCDCEEPYDMYADRTPTYRPYTEKTEKDQRNFIRNENEPNPDLDFVKFNKMTFEEAKPYRILFGSHYTGNYPVNFLTWANIGTTLQPYPKNYEFIDFLGLNRIEFVLQIPADGAGSAVLFENTPYGYVVDETELITDYENNGNGVFAYVDYCQALKKTIEPTLTRTYGHYFDIYYHIDSSDFDEGIKMEYSKVLELFNYSEEFVISQFDDTQDDLTTGFSLTNILKGPRTAIS